MFDFGGGTCDVSILDIKGKDFVVKASRGDNQLGGEDYDGILTQHIADRLQTEQGMKLENSHMRRLRYMAEIAKCRLSDSLEYKIELLAFVTA